LISNLTARKNSNAIQYNVKILQSLSKSPRIKTKKGNEIKFSIIPDLASDCECNKTNSTFKKCLFLLSDLKYIESYTIFQLNELFPPKSPIPNEIKSRRVDAIFVLTDLGIDAVDEFNKSKHKKLLLGLDRLV
jgi:hypothetical protein